MRAEKLFAVGVVVASMMGCGEQMQNESTLSQDDGIDQAEVSSSSGYTLENPPTKGDVVRFAGLRIVQGQSIANVVSALRSKGLTVKESDCVYFTCYDTESDGQKLTLHSSGKSIGSIILTLGTANTSGYRKVDLGDRRSSQHKTLDVSDEVRQTFADGFKVDIAGTSVRLQIRGDIDALAARVNSQLPSDARVKVESGSDGFFGTLKWFVLRVSSERQVVVEADGSTGVVRSVVQTDTIQTGARSPPIIIITNYNTGLFKQQGDELITMDSKGYAKRDVYFIRGQNFGTEFILNNHGL